jgi:5-methylcytosine-specific restriction endonuclease McrA
LKENKSGENSYRWKGGHAKNYGDRWSRHRRIIADYYSNCQACGDEGKDVHHIIPYKKFESDKEANHLTNLIYLCRDCHAKVEIGNKRCPEPDTVRNILTGVGEICHEECLQHAEQPSQVIDEIDGFEPV